MSKIRVLELGMTDNVGGIETYLFNQFKRVDSQQFHYTFFNDNHPCLAFEKDILSLGGEIINCSIDARKSPFHFLKQFCIALKEGNFDIVIMNANMFSRKQIMMLSLAKESGVPVRILHAHNSNQSFSIKGILGKISEYPISAWNWKKTITQRWACSKDAGRFFFSKQPFEVINNGIDTDAYTFNETIRDKVRNEMHVAPDTLVLGNVGRITYAKNQSFLIPVAATLHEQGVPVQLWLVGPVQQGDDEEMEKVKQAIEEHHAEDYVKLLGMRRDVQNLLMAMDVFLLPSQYEGLPVVGIEAQCTGLPCVFSCGVPKEAKFTDNVEFVPIDQGPQPWVDAIKRVKVLGNRKEGAEVVKRAGFDVSQQVQTVQTLLAKYLQESGKV